MKTWKDYNVILKNRKEKENEKSWVGVPRGGGNFLDTQYTSHTQWYKRTQLICRTRSAKRRKFPIRLLNHFPIPISQV